MNNSLLVIKKAVLINPYLFEAKTFANGQSKYSTGFIVSKEDNENIAILNACIEHAIPNYDPKEKSKYKLPIRDGDLEHPQNMLYKNSYFLYATSETRPDVFDHNLKELYGRTPICNGDYANVCISFEAYTFGNTKGVSCILNGVQKLPLKSRLLEIKPDIKSMFKVEKY